MNQSKQSKEKSEARRFVTRTEDRLNFFLRLEVFVCSPLSLDCLSKLPVYSYLTANVVFLSFLVFLSLEDLDLRLTMVCTDSESATSLLALPPP